MFRPDTFSSTLSCCATCDYVLEPKDIKISKGNDQFIYQDSLKKEVAGNERLMHDMIQRIVASNNPFELFDVLYVDHFKSERKNNNLKLMSVFERIFLRALRFANHFETPSFTQHTIKENVSVKLTTNILGLVNLSIAENGNSRDVPRKLKQIVLCSDETFTNFTYMVLLATSGVLKPLAEQILIRYLVGKVEQMFSLTKANPIFTIGRRNVAYSYLTFVRQELADKFEIFRNQRVQIHEIVGESGQGKSMAAISLTQVIHAIVPFIPLNELIYTRANDYWWNGYCGQPIILYDDFTHIKKKIKFDLNYELIAVASGTFQNPPMAFEKNTVFTSLLVIVTSNIPIITTTSVLETQNALKRRIISQHWSKKTNVELISGTLYNYTEGADNRNVFSLLLETQNILNSTEIVEFTIDESLLEYDEMDSNESLSTSLTSSVAESYSGSCVDSCALNEHLISASFQKEKTAQLNQVVREVPILSVVALGVLADNIKDVNAMPPDMKAAIAEFRKRLAKARPDLVKPRTASPAASQIR